MTINVVNVTIEATAAPYDATSVEGNFTCCPDGKLYPAVSGGRPIVPAIVHGILINGTATAVLNWDYIINIRGLPTVKASNLTINFASGGTQDIWTILTNNGWTPVQKP